MSTIGTKERVKQIILYYIKILHWLYSTGDYSRTKYIFKNLLDNDIGSTQDPTDINIQKYDRKLRARKNFERFYNSDMDFLQKSISDKSQKCLLLLEDIFIQMKELGLADALIDHQLNPKAQLIALYTRTSLGSSARRGNAIKVIRKALSNFITDFPLINNSMPISNLNIIYNDYEENEIFKITDERVEQISQEIVSVLYNYQMPVAELIRIDRIKIELKKPRTFSSLEHLYELSSIENQKIMTARKEAVNS